MRAMKPKVAKSKATPPEVQRDEWPFGDATAAEVAVQLAPLWRVQESDTDLWVKDRVAWWLVQFGIRYGLHPHPCRSVIAEAWPGVYIYPYPDKKVYEFVHPEYITCPPDNYSRPPDIDGCDWVRPWWTSRNERLMTAFWPPRKRDGEGTYKPFVNAEHAHVAPACAEWLGAASEDEVEYYILDLRSFHFPLTDQLFLIAGRRGYDVGRLYEQIRKTEHKVRSDMTLYRSSNSGTEHKPRSGMALYQSPSNSDHSA